MFVALEEELGRRLTLDEVIAAEMATVQAPLEQVVAWLAEHVRVRPGFRELVDAYDPLIVSAGFHELIEPILEREGIAARVAANHVAADPRGWRASFPDARPLCGLRRAVQAERGRGARPVRIRRRRRLRSLRLARGGTALRPRGPRALAGRAGRLVRAVRGSLRRAQRAGGALVPPTLSRGRNTYVGSV